MNIRINLLPPGKKEEFKNLRMIGVSLKIGLVGVFALLTFLIFLEFSKKAIMIQSDYLAGEIARFEKNEGYREVKESQDFFRDSSKMATKVQQGLGKQNDYYLIVDHLNRLIPEGIILKEMSLEDGNLKLLGIAQTRQSLLFLKESLEQSETFTAVQSPISNLVSDEKISFEFTAKIKLQ